MIEGISAVTLGTHDMPRAVRFYRALGFEIQHGGEESTIHQLSSRGELS
jgi:catechol 2,3-dioxygenase-like lactoylglutathione lyase family enzyme